jgi:hypothetical protein
MTRDAIHELAALPPADPIASRPRIIVAPSASVFILARMFQIAGRATRPGVHVVRKAPQALALLGVTIPHFKTFEPRFSI